MSAAQIEKDSREYRERIKALRVENGSYPFPDGILDTECPENYSSCSQRIVWVLKEAVDYDNGDKYPEGYSTKMLNDWKQKSTCEGGLFAKIALTSYGILHGNMSWGDLPPVYRDDTPEDEKSFDALKHIAIVNIKKITGTTRADDQVVTSYYFDSAQNLVNKQIKSLQPHIVIFGFPRKNKRYEQIIERIFSSLCGDDKFSEELANGKFCGCKAKGVIFVWAYHPAYFCMREKDYCTTIINLVAELTRHNRTSS
jgi:hypothetical protein